MAVSTGAIIEHFDVIVDLGIGNITSGLAGAVVGDRLYFASGDIQSAGITRMRIVTDSHDIFEFGQR